MLLTFRCMLAAAALPLVAAAQNPARKPSPRPDPVTKVVPSLPKLPREAPLPPLPPDAPMPPLPPEPLVSIEPRLFDLPMELHIEPLQLQVHKLQIQAEAKAHLDIERIAMRSEEIKMRAEEAAQRVAKMDLDRRFTFERSFELFDAEPDRLLKSKPRAGWASEDPADSLYRQAREALNRGEYRRAAQLFGDVTKKFPKSVYAADCAYYEAFARYRSGTTDDLKEALKILESADFSTMRSGRESSVDIPALKARVQGALAARGDRKAASDLKNDLSKNEGCDREDISVRAEALSALGQMDPASAMPVVKKVLARHDDCTVELRRRALYLIGRQSDAESAALILDVAKNDTDSGLRSEAMRWLPRVAGDNAVPQLEELLRTSTDENTQRSAIYALSSIDTDRARRAVRAIIERNDAAERVRYEAIMSFSREKEGRSISTEEMAYLRTLYNKVESARLREAVLTSISRVETNENSAFLMTVAKNQNENTSLRATALQRLGRMQSVSAADFAKLYDVADARSLREQILYALSQRKEPEAIDKMMEVARKDTDPNIRRTAISLLARSNNERAKQLLKELIDQ